MSESSRAEPGRPELASILEGLIFAADNPVSLAEMLEVLGRSDEKPLRRALDELERRLDESGSGLQLEQVAGGYRLATRSEVGEWVRRLYRFRNRRRLTPAALETLAIVAYRQPITGPEIQQLRGVDPGGTLGSLLERRLVRILGRKKVVGRPLLYATTRDFLMHFGLNSLEDLPSLDAFESLLGAEQRDRLEQAGPATRPEEVEPLEGEAAEPGESAGAGAEAEDAPEAGEGASGQARPG
jgi:segregation and condensation protein B